MKNLSVGCLLMGLLCFTDITAQNITQLLNIQVQTAQRYERLLGSPAGMNLPASVPIVGVVVETVDGGRWLIHKGSDYGLDVTEATFMSTSWYTVGPEKTISQSTVGDYLAAGGSDNCWKAASRMMDLE